MGTQHSNPDCLLYVIDFDESKSYSQLQQIINKQISFTEKNYLLTEELIKIFQEIPASCIDFEVDVLLDLRF